MSASQEGIFKDGSNHFTFLEFKLNEEVLSHGLISKLKSLEKPTKVNEVVCFGCSCVNAIMDQVPNALANQLIGEYLNKLILAENLLQ